MDGNFSLEVSPGDELEVSYVGYSTKLIKTGNSSSLSVVMKEDNKALGEIVVIGYGTQRKADLTGSVANVDATKLNTQSNSTIGQALQGKIAGVDIVSQGGQPGSGSRIMVRGIGTLIMPLHYTLLMACICRVLIISILPTFRVSMC